MSGCGRCRDLLSAELDGETVEVPGSTTRSSTSAVSIHRHLRDCPECMRWFARVTQVNRLLRTAPAEPGPGLSAAQLAHVLGQLPPPPSRRRIPMRRVARVALAVVGAAQALIGVLPLLLPGPARLEPLAVMTGPRVGAAMVHMSHEFSAWNLALGVSFLLGAGWTRHLAGALPVLVSFVVVLATVSVIDLLDGRVDPARVVSHALVLLGVGLIVLIVRTGAPNPTVRPGLTRPADPEPSAVGDPVGHTAGHPAPGLDGPAGQGGPSPAARAA